MANRTGLGGTTLQESYGEHTQTRTFENHATLLAYLANSPLYTLENGFQGAPRQPFPRLHCLQKLPKRALTTTQLCVLLIM